MHHPARKYLWITVALACGAWILVVTTARPPEQFPVNSIVTVQEGESVRSVSRTLERMGVIRSASLFANLAIVMAGERGLKAGDYYLAQSYSAPELAWRMTRGTYDLAPIKVTVPEGFTIEQVAVVMAEKFYRFDTEEFIRIAAPYEGYLFPETYFFLPNVQAEEVLETMRDMFVTKALPVLRDRDTGEVLSPEIQSDTIILASLVEEEGITVESRRVIAGILQNRLERNTPLQVDATVGYIFRTEGAPKPSLALTKTDLAADSPYNTYRRVGLPPAPIASPGLESIRAALDPIHTAYFFYLSDAENIFHYAHTYEEHLRNIKKYLPQ